MSDLDDENKNHDPESQDFFADDEVDEIRKIDVDQLSEEVLKIIEQEKLVIDGELLKIIFMRIYGFYENLFDEGTFLDDLHEECEYEELNIPFAVLESALNDALKESNPDIPHDRDKLFEKFAAQLMCCVIIK